MEMELSNGPQGLIVRDMARDEFDAVVEWAIEEGWNPGLHDGDCFFETDPGGFFLALLDGEPVGGVSAVAYDASFGFAGFFLVKKDLRRLGIGSRLGAAVFEHMGDRNIGVDAITGMVNRYTAAGFEQVYLNARYRVKAKSAPFGASEGLVPLDSLDFDDILAFDSRFFPARRERFLRSWLQQPGGHGLAKVDGGTILGYAFMRPCLHGYKFGPLFAENVDTASALFDSLAARVAGETVFLDVPEPNTEGLRLAEERGMRQVVETARMYNRGDPGLPLEKIFGVTSFELG